jgi:hypothetical protein
VIHEALPNKSLESGFAISKSFSNHGLDDFHQACDYVWRLPYGRNKDRSDWRLVLSESCGTCSTKHALLKALADGLALDVDLMVGIYQMREDNTPGVGRVLAEFGIAFIPEAHCYLAYRGKRVDLTRHGFEASEGINEFFAEMAIDPSGIGELKTQFHQNYIKGEYGSLGFERVWSAREACIKALSELDSSGIRSIGATAYINHH